MVALCKGKLEFSDLVPEILVDPEILSLAERITYELDEHTDYPAHYPAEVVLLLKDGTSRTHREAINRGAPDLSLTTEEIREKFMANATLALSETQAQRLEEAVMEMERPHPLGRLVGLLQSSAAG